MRYSYVILEQPCHMGSNNIKLLLQLLVPYQWDINEQDFCIPVSRISDYNNASFALVGSNLKEGIIFSEK